MMIGGERRNLSNNTAMLRGLAQLFVHTPQSMHMPQPKIILKKRGLRKRGLELYGELDFGPFRLRFVPFRLRFGSVWIRFGSVSGLFRVRFGVSGWGRGDGLL